MHVIDELLVDVVEAPFRLPCIAAVLPPELASSCGEHIRARNVPARQNFPSMIGGVNMR